MVKGGVREGSKATLASFFVFLLSAPGRGRCTLRKGKVVSLEGSPLLTQNKACGLKVHEYYEMVLNVLHMEIVDDQEN